MKRHALFVGVNNYMDNDIRNLRYSIPDAAVLADRFKGFGYKTRLLSDPTSAELRAAVLDSIDGLGRGDVFLFFFAGHGFTAQDGSHLLFCRDDIQKLLRVGNAGVKVDALEMLTCEGGFHRAFFLDSCRTDCFTGVENRGNEETRDLDFVKIPEPTDETGSYYLLRSCDKFRPSLEIKELGHGLFTQGLLDAIDARDRRLGGCNTDFATAVSVKMADRQKQYNVDISQRPSIGEFSGSVFSLFDDEFFSDIEKSDLSTMQSSPRVSTATLTYVECPICGKKNKVEDTFKCRQCGSDNLCLRHQDEKTFLCFSCAEKSVHKVVTVVEERKESKTNSIKRVQLWEGGPYWADRNIGAENPWDSGYYFWWGDTVGYKWVNDEWVASDGSNYSFVFIDANVPTHSVWLVKSIGIGKLRRDGWISASHHLTPDHDAAQKHWGGDWRMPTNKELQDLSKLCDWTWTKVKGVNGYVVRGRGSYSSAEIFLPCTGHGYGTFLYGAGSNGTYWSSVPYSDYDVSWGLSFDSGNHSTSYGYDRSSGRSVRPLQGFTEYRTRCACREAIRLGEYEVRTAKQSQDPA